MDELESMKVKSRKRIIERVIVVATGMEESGGYGSCGLIVEGTAYNSEMANIVMTRTGKFGDLLTERERRIEN